MNSTIHANQLLQQIFCKDQLDFSKQLPLLQDQIGQIDAIIQTKKQDIQNNVNFIQQQQQTQDLYSISYIQPLNQKINQLLSQTLQVNQSLENLQKSRFLLQIFLDFIAQIAINIQLKSEFSVLNPVIPPNILYIFRNPYRRAQMMFILKNLAIFKPIKYAASINQNVLNVNTSLFSAVKLQLSNDLFTLYWNQTCENIEIMIEGFQLVEIYPEQQVMEQCKQELVSIQKNQISNKLELIEEKPKFTSEYYKIVDFLNTPQPNFPSAHQTFSCLKAVGGTGWNLKNLIFECLFLIQVNDLPTDFIFQVMREIENNDSYNFSQRQIEIKMIDIRDFFNKVKNITINVLKLAESLCKDQILKEQIVNFSTDYLLKIFVQKCTKIDHLTTLQYIGSLFKKFTFDIQTCKFDQIKLKFQAKQFGYPSQVSKTSQCKVKTFLDHFRQNLTIPISQNFFLQKVKQLKQNKEIDTTEYVDLSKDLQSQLYYFQNYLQYEDFGLIFKQFDFHSYIRNKILSDTKLNFNQQKVKEIKQYDIICKESIKWIKEAIENRIKLNKQLQQALQQFNDMKGRKNQADEDIIKQKYSQIDQNIVQQVQQCLLSIINFEKKYVKESKKVKLFQPDSLVLPNSYIQGLIPQLPASLILLNEYNDLSNDQVEFDQETMQKYFQDLRTNNINHQVYLDLLTENQLKSIKQPWVQIIYESTNNENSFQFFTQQLNLLQNTNFDKHFLNQTVKHIFELLLKQQLTLEEINLKEGGSLSSIVLDQNLDQNIFSSYIKIDQNILLDDLHISNLFEMFINRILLLSSQKFSMNLDEKFTYSTDFQIKICNQIKQFSEQVCVKIKMSTFAILDVIKQQASHHLSDLYVQINKMIFPNMVLSVCSPAIKPCLIQQDILNPKFYKIIENQIQHKLNQKVNRKTIFNLIEQLNLQQNCLPFGYSIPESKFAILDENNLIKLIQMCDQAIITIQKIVVNFFNQLKKFNSDFQVKISQQLQIIFKNLEIYCQQLIYVQVELLLSACRFIWSSCYKIDFSVQQIGTFTLHDLQTKNQLLIESDSTPTHAKFISQIILQNFPFFKKKLLQELALDQFLLSFVIHILRFDLKRFETILIFKQELTFYERIFIEKFAMKSDKFTQIKTIMCIQSYSIEDTANREWKVAMENLKQCIWQ